MKTRGFFAAAVAAFVCSGLALAQSTPWPPPGVSYYGDPSAPDISGLWLGTALHVPGSQVVVGNRGTADGRPPTFWAPWPLPYTPAYQKIYDERIAAAARGRQLGDISAMCRPFGMPWMLVSNFYPHEIVQTPGAVTFFMNSTFPIVVWTDGRGHPKDLQPSYNGHTVGYWVGDTLFAETVGIRGDTPLEHMRNPRSGKSHLKWTLRKVAKETLHIQVTVYDEDAFAEPVTTTAIWRRMNDANWQVLDDASCFENNAALPNKQTTMPEGFRKY